MQKKWKPEYVSKKITHEECWKTVGEAIQNRNKIEIENKECKVISSLRELKKKKCIKSYTI